MYLWTLDESKDRKGGHCIDLALLHSVKQQELVIEVTVQFILQLVNAALRGELSTAYIISASACAFDCLSCIYRYGWYTVHDEKIEDASSIEISRIESLFAQYEAREEAGAEAKIVSNQEGPSLLGGLWTAVSTIYDWGSKIDEALSGDVAAYDERVAQEAARQLELVLQQLRENPNPNYKGHTEEDIRAAMVDVLDEFRNGNTSSPDVDDEESARGDGAVMVYLRVGRDERETMML